MMEELEVAGIRGWFKDFLVIESLHTESIQFGKRNWDLKNETKKSYCTYREV